MDVEITIDGERVVAQDGELLIKAINRVVSDLPQICYNEVLGPIRSCDTCVVEVGGELVRSCDTMVRASLVVDTKSVRSKDAQLEGISRILKNHDLYCTLCENNNGNCVVHNTVAASEIAHPSYEFEKKPYEIDASHPFYRYDPNQCILCGRCVQACQELQVNETLSIDWERDRPRVIWDQDVPAGESSCVGCGHCVTVCPCNALMEKSMLGEVGYLSSLPETMKDPMIALTKAAEPATSIQSVMAISEAEARLRKAQIKRTKTVCTYCGVGCSFEVWTKGRKIVKVEPSDGPANAVSTCVKGKFGWDYVNSKERITAPLIRRGDHFEEVTFEEAINYVAERMKAIKVESGPNALGFISSSKCTNEESYLMQKLARAVIGTNNVDNCSRYCQSPATVGLWRTVGIGGDSGSITDLEKAGLVIIVGSNTAESHPVIATRIKRAHKSGGKRLIVADLRRHEMAERADIFIHPNPGSDIAWLSAVTKYIIDTNRHDIDFIDSHVDHFDEYYASLSPFDLESTAKLTGISVDELKAVAEEIVTADGVAVCWAMGVTQHNGGSDTSSAISNLLLVTGNYAREGAGSYPLRGHNNVQGASDFGAMPDRFPGYEFVNDDATRAKWSAGWNVELPSDKGLDNHEMVDAIYGGSLRGLYLIGEDMGLVDANALHVQGAFERLDLFVVQDIFFSKTAQFADVILPASPSLEKDGTFTNTERRIQRLYAALEPLGNSRPDYIWTIAIANALGAGWSYESPADVMAEAASLAEIFSGVSYDLLEGFDSLQWPVSSDGEDTPLLFLDGFGFSNGRAKFYNVSYIEPSEVVDDEFDLHLNNGRLLEHFHEGNMTFKSEGIRSRTPGTFIEISPELAAERGVQSGSLVRLISRRGKIKARALVTTRVSGKELYMPMNSGDNESAINVLTSSHTDRTTHTPAYKELAVKMEVLSATGESPLPRKNFRNAIRNPQNGVEVERKWQRQDYVFVAAPRRRGRL